ncbi:hypothetical protein [Sinomonas atrocyanea]|uniref:hypothetical protein n=1 Tax=Sinomonas atrocyanea TaxID=37927 RepID=UPI003D99FF43
MNRRFVPVAAVGLLVLTSCTPVSTEAGLEGIDVGPVSIRPVDGGADYYSRFSPSLPSKQDWFPLGVWSESLVDEQGTKSDKEASINVYVELTEDSQPERAATIGASVILSSSVPGIAGYLLGDEVDMWGGVGDHPWTGNYPGQGEICDPPDQKCGYTIMEALQSRVPVGMLSFANFGKGVLFWESEAEAARFLVGPDVVSADAYWLTDPNICSGTEGGNMLAGGKALDELRCRQPSNYGAMVERVRSFISPRASKPVWAFVEVGHPFPNGKTASAPEVRAAVWSSLIHGARGIIYFNHSFGGPCPSHHVLREACDPVMRSTVSDLNRQLTELAPVLNAPFVDAAATVTGDADVAVKVLDGQLYVLAASTAGGPQDVSITVPCWTGGNVSVIGEGRQLSAPRLTVHDAFDGPTAVHVYRLDGGNRCGL